MSVLNGHTLTAAIQVALEVHEHQTRKGNGEPYILHPLRVMLAVPEEARIVAVLHDVFEDWHLEVEELKSWPVEGIRGAELEALRLLTRPEGVTYGGYIERIQEAPGEAGRLARLVKRADLEDNLRDARAAGLESLVRKYERALEEWDA